MFKQGELVTNEKDLSELMGTREANATLRVAALSNVMSNLDLMNQGIVEAKKVNFGVGKDNLISTKDNWAKMMMICNKVNLKSPQKK